MVGFGIFFGLFLLGVIIDNGLGNIANALVAYGLIEKGMTPEEVKEYVERLKEKD